MGVPCIDHNVTQDVAAMYDPPFDKTTELDPCDDLVAHVMQVSSQGDNTAVLLYDSGPQLLGLAEMMMSWGQSILHGCRRIRNNKTEICRCNNNSSK